MAAYEKQINTMNPEIVGSGNDGEPLRNPSNESKDSSKTKKCLIQRKNQEKGREIRLLRPSRIWTQRTIKKPI